MGWVVLLLLWGGAETREPPPWPISKMVPNHINRWLYDAYEFFLQNFYFGGFYSHFSKKYTVWIISFKKIYNVCFCQVLLRGLFIAMFELCGDTVRWSGWLRNCVIRTDHMCAHLGLAFSNLSISGFMLSQTSGPRYLVICRKSTHLYTKPCSYT